MYAQTYTYAGTLVDVIETKENLIMLVGCTGICVKEKTIPPLETKKSCEILPFNKHPGH